MTTTTPKRSVAQTLESLEQENKMLRSALVRMKHLVEYCQEGNRTSNALLEGAYNYCKQKKASASKSTPQRRAFHSFPLSVQVQGHSLVDGGDHYEYHIQVRFGESGGGHQTRKRYSEFFALRAQILQSAKMAVEYSPCSGAFQAQSGSAGDVNYAVYQLLTMATFPGKTWRARSDAAFLEKRAQHLGAFLQQAVEAGRRAGRGSRVRAQISEWLGITQRDEDIVWCDERIRPLLEHDSRTKASRNSEAFQSLLDQHQEPTPVRNVKFLMGEEEED